MALPREKTRILSALGLLLEPVILLLLKCGVSWKEFAAVARTRFVEVAAREFGIRGRPTNTSRIAILTGMDRREVQKLRNAAETPSASERSFVSKPTLVLEAWHREAEFLTGDGKPRELDIEGEQGSFAVLARRYAPGLPVVAMIKELGAAGSIEKTPAGKLRVLKRAYIPRRLAENQIRLWGSTLHDHATTLEHNLTERRGRPRFERRALSLDVDRDALQEFREFLESEGQAFLERVDAWLEAHSASARNAPASRAIRLGVGVYHIEDAPTGVRRAS